MDIYTRKSWWKWWLAFFGLIIIAISAYFTIYLTQKLSEEERVKVEQFVFAQELLQKENTKAAKRDSIHQANGTQDNCPSTELSLHLNILQGNTTIPVILENQLGGIDAHVNFNENADIEEELRKMKESGQQPIEAAEGVNIYFKKSRLLQLLEIFPFVQLLLITFFIGLGYLFFSTARRSEQNQVWVGMAKETAHQLGTPIMGIIGWIDYLKEMNPEDEEINEAVTELRNDVNRLELIADRFSKIGSDPELQPSNIFDELEAIRIYMEKRAPRKTKFDFPDPTQTPIFASVNSHLLQWVFENLIRNSIDALEKGQGIISAEVNDLGDKVEVLLSDTGMGIPASKLKTVFQPGYSTKKRGWGLGLSLAKRIIASYHKGKIFVKSSEVGKGTTFSIQLMKVKAA